MDKRNRTLTAFEEQVKTALRKLHDPVWLGENSPLAELNFLGSHPMINPSTKQRGLLLCQLLTETQQALWGEPLPASAQAIVEALHHENSQPGSSRYDFWLLDLNYFQHYLPVEYNRRKPLEQATIYNDILHISRQTHDRYLQAALKQFCARLLMRVRPRLRAERPCLRTPLVGRTLEHKQCRQRLENGQTVMLSGAGGMGKSALGIALYQSWLTSSAFWWTVRPTLNDDLTSLLFALGEFLQQQGASALWGQLIARGSEAQDRSLLVALAQQDLSWLRQNNQLPLLCFDELDLLRPALTDQALPRYTAILEFIAALRGHAALLLIGQHAILENDYHYHLTGLAIEAINTLFINKQILIQPDELRALAHWTNGNPRLLDFCALHRQAGLPLPTQAAALSNTTTLFPLLQRIWQRLSAQEREILQLLTVFRSPVPGQIFKEQQPLLHSLIERHLISQDQHEGVECLPIFRHFLYAELPIETRQKLHAVAAFVRSERGQYTAAAYHYLQANAPAKAVTLLYPQLEHEIQLGAAASAMQIFQQIAITHLPAPLAQTVVLARSRLYQLQGAQARALAEVESLQWQPKDALWLTYLQESGRALEGLGQGEEATRRYDEGITEIANLLQQKVFFTVRRGHVAIAERNLTRAWQDACRALYEAERLQGLVQGEMNNPAVARKHLLMAAAIAEDLTDQRLTAKVNEDLALLAGRQGNLTSAQQYAQKAIEHYQQIGDQFNAHCVLANLAAAYVMVEDYRQAVAIGEEAFAFFARVKLGAWVAPVAATLAESWFWLDNFPRAEEYARLLIEQEEQQFYPYGLYTLADIRRVQQQWIQAEQLYQRTQQMAQQNQDYVLEAYTQRGLGLVYRAMGKEQEAITCLYNALYLFQRMGNTVQHTKTQACIQQQQKAGT